MTGLQQYYGSSIDDPYSIAALYQKTCALAFVPVFNINQLWCPIIDDFDRVPGTHQVFDYVAETWMDSDSLFSKKLWNYYCFQGLHTNNRLEEWHHRLNSNIDATNANLYLVLEELKNDYISKMATIAQVKHQ